MAEFQTEMPQRTHSIDHTSQAVTSLAIVAFCWRTTIAEAAAATASYLQNARNSFPLFICCTCAKCIIREDKMNRSKISYEIPLNGIICIYKHNLFYVHVPLLLYNAYKSAHF